MILRAIPAAKVQLRASRGGVFEITVDGRLRYSKRTTGAFPTEAEILATIDPGP